MNGKSSYRSSSFHKHLGRFEGCQEDEFLNPTELTRLQSSSIEELSIVSPHPDLSSSSLAMVPQKKGRPISMPSDPPLSPNRRNTGSWNTGFHHPHHNHTLKFHSKGPIPRLHTPQNQPPGPGRENASCSKIFRTAISAIQPNPQSTIKSLRSIRGAAQRHNADLVHAKGKGKAIEPPSLQRIDLTSETDDDVPDDMHHPIEKAFVALKKHTKIRNHPNNPDNEESDDPMRISHKPKKVELMEGKPRRPASKPIPRSNLHHPPQNNSNSTTSSIGDPVHLAKVGVYTHDGNLTCYDFSTSQATCHIHCQPESSDPLALVIMARELNPPGPTLVEPLKILREQIHKISVRTPSSSQPQLILHLSHPLMDKDQSRIWNAVAARSSLMPGLSPTPCTCFLEAFDHPNTIDRPNDLRTISEVLNSRPPLPKIDQLDNSWKIFFPEEEHSDTDSLHSSPSKKAETTQASSPEITALPSDVPVQPITCSASTSELPSHPPIGNSSRSGPQISTQVYKPGNLQSRVSSPQLTFHSSDATANVSVQNAPGDECNENRNNHHVPKKTLAKQASHDLTLSSRYNTRSSLLQPSIRSPLDPSPDHPLGTCISEVDSDIVLIWPFDDDRCTGSVAITKGDLKRLAEGEFINDTLIEFGLKWELSEIQKNAPESVASIHLFNSFFFQKLSSFKSHRKLTAAEEAKQAYEGVRKWTKGLDVFKKNFLVIPINEHMHWYFIIVSNPGKFLEPRIQNPATNSHMSPASTIRTRQSQKILAMEDVSAPNIRTTTPEEISGELPEELAVELPEELKISAQSTPPDETDDKAEVDSSNLNSAVDKSAQGFEHMNLDDQDQDGPDRVVNDELPSDKTALPYVLTLDSLGTSHRAQSQIILRYLINESDDKLNQTLPESLLKTVHVKKVPVPEQPNHCDCGLYLIHAFKTFFSKPDVLLKWIVDNPKKKSTGQMQDEVQTLWDAAGAAQARQTLRTQVYALIPQYQEKMKLKKAAADGKKKTEQAKTRRLSCCTDVPSTPTNPEKTIKKPRITGPDLNASIRPLSSNSSFSPKNSRNVSNPSGHPPQSSSSSRKSNRFLAGSSNSKAEKDEIYASCNKVLASSSKDSVKKRSSTTNPSQIPSSPLETMNASSDTEVRHAQLIGSSKSSKVSETRVGSEGSVTPDEELMLTSEPSAQDRPSKTMRRSILVSSSSNPSLNPTDEVFIGQRKMRVRVNDEEHRAGGFTAAGSSLESANYDGEPLEEEGDWKQESSHLDSLNEHLIQCQPQHQSNTSNHEHSNLKIKLNENHHHLFKLKPHLDQNNPVGLASSLNRHKQSGHTHHFNPSLRNKKFKPASSSSSSSSSPTSLCVNKLIKSDDTTPDRLGKNRVNSAPDLYASPSGSHSKLISPKSHRSQFDDDVNMDTTIDNNTTVVNNGDGENKAIKDVPVSKKRNYSTSSTSPPVIPQLSKGNLENPVTVDD